MKNSIKICLITVLIFLFNSYSSYDLFAENITTKNYTKIAVIPIKKSNNITNLDNMDLFEFNQYFYKSLKKKLHSKYDLILFDFNKKEKYGEVDLYLELLIRGYIEREGSDIGVSSPASVIIVADLIKADTRQVIWSYKFSESQQPLLYDVSKIKKFIKRRGRWVKAKQLIKEGLDEIAEDLKIYLTQK